jgi:hypothetical protein
VSSFGGCITGYIANWRKQFSVDVPIQYVFESGSPGEDQIHQIWKDCLLYKHSEDRFGVVPEGVMFQNKRHFKPLQASDILAWQTQNHMRRTVMIGRDPIDRSLAHKGFLMLRENRPLELAFYSREQIREAMDNTKAYHDEKGVWPWEPETGAVWYVRRVAPGAV